MPICCSIVEDAPAAQAVIMDGSVRAYEESYGTRALTVHTGAGDTVLAP